MFTRGQPSPRLGYLPVSPHRLTTTQFGSHAPLHPHPPPKGRMVKRSFGWLASLDSSWALLCRYGNINPLSIDYACRPRLRSRLTQGRLA
jgi:hypothetical protein